MCLVNDNSISQDKPYKNCTLYVLCILYLYGVEAIFRNVNLWLHIK